PASRGLGRTPAAGERPARSCGRAACGALRGSSRQSRKHPGSLHALRGSGYTVRMPYSHTVRSERFAFADLRELLAKANEPKSGDELAGIAARSERERVGAKLALADVTLGEIVANPVIDPAADDVSRLILDTHDRDGFAPIRHLTVGEFRELLLREADLN